MKVLQESIYRQTDRQTPRQTDRHEDSRYNCVLVGVYRQCRTFLCLHSDNILMSMKIKCWNPDRPIYQLLFTFKFKVEISMGHPKNGNTDILCLLV